MSQAWRSTETADVFEYVRAYNARHRDKVYFAGVEYYATRQLSYDAIDQYVARHAPDRLEELRRSLLPIRPNTTDMGKYVQWYWKEVKDKAPYISKARAVYALVRDLPDQVVVHHARQYQLRAAGIEVFSLDLNRPAGSAVREWLNGTAKTRGYPEAGPTSCMTGGSVAEWFDVLIHCRHVTPVHDLGHPY